MPGPDTDLLTYQKVWVVTADGSIATFSGGGDATAANQTLQITQETAINTVLGTPVASPAANTIGDRLKQLLTGTILAAGNALIGKFGIDQTTPGTTNAISLAQVGATTVATGNGVVGAGVQRVAIASDNTAFPVTATLAAGAAVVGKVSIDQTTPGTTNLVALAANQSVNTAQMNGVAVTMGNGASSTGVQRVSIASDSTGNIATIGTSVTPGVAATNLGKAEDAAHVTGDTGVAVWAVRTDTAAASSGTTGDYEAFHTDALGKLWTADNQVEDAPHTSGDRGSFSLCVGNEAQSTLAADGDYIGHSVDTKGNALTVGNLAHDAVDAGFPVKIGAQARTTNPAAVSDADRSNIITDKVGKVIAVSAIRQLKGTQMTTITSSTAETTIVTAVASTFLDLYGLVITNSSASATSVAIKDTTAGTTILTVYVPAGDTRGLMLDAGSAIAQTTVNTNWTATSSVSVASLVITALYVKNI